MNVVVDWNGKDLPDELKELPAGRYVVEPVDDAPLLTEEEDEGLREAMRSLARGEGMPGELVRRRLETRTRK
jgi:hypothetical protein